MRSLLTCVAVAVLANLVGVDAQAVATAALTGLDPLTLGGSSVAIDLAIENTGDVPGFRPFLDLAIPTDQITGLSSPTAFGAPLSDVHTLTFGETPSCQDHPFAYDTSGAPVEVCAQDMTVLVMPLPLTGFAPDIGAIAASVSGTISSTLPEGTVVDVYGRTGFGNGNTISTGDYASDPSILSSPSSDVTTWSSMSTIVSSIVITYTYEPANPLTGLPWTSTMTMEVDLAVDKEITNATLSTYLPAHAQFIAAGAVVGGAHTTNLPSTSGPFNQPDSDLSVNFPGTIVGTTAGVDASFSWTVYVPEFDANGDPVLDEATGDFDLTPTSESFTLEYDGALAPLVSNTQTLTGDAFKASCSQTPSTGKPATEQVHTISFSTSAYFTFSNLLQDYVLPDGIRFNHGVSPTVTYDGTGPFSFTENVNFWVDESQIQNDTAGASTGETYIFFNMSAVLPTAHGSIVGPGTGSLSFSTTVLDERSDTLVAGVPNLLQGQTLTSSCSMTVSIADRDTGAPTEETITESSSSSYLVSPGSLVVSNYATNGVQCYPSCGSDVTYPSLTNITFLLEYTMPSSDFLDFTLDGFLPAPLLNVDGLPSPFSLQVGSPTGIPNVNEFSVGPTDTLLADVGFYNISTNVVNNQMTLVTGELLDSDNNERVLSVLYTLQVGSLPWDDGQSLVPVYTTVESSGAGGLGRSESNVRNSVSAPVFGAMYGGLVALQGRTGAYLDPSVAFPTAMGTFSSPGSSDCPRFSGSTTDEEIQETPFNSAGFLVDAGDNVTFLFGYENSGSANAYDVNIRGYLSEEFRESNGAIPACITNAAGTPLPYSGLFKDASGATVTVMGNTGSPAGENVIVISTDQALVNTVPFGEQIDALFQVCSFAGAPGAPNYLEACENKTATVTTASPTVTLSIVNSTDPYTTGATVDAGERVVLQALIDLPEGSATNLTLVMTLPDGAAGSLVYLPSLSTVDTIGSQVTVASQEVVANGQTITALFGAVQNEADNIESASDQIAVLFAVDVELLSATATLLPQVQLLMETTNVEEREVDTDSLTLSVVESGLTLATSGVPATGDAQTTITNTATITPLVTGGPLHEVVLLSPGHGDMSIVEGSISVSGLSEATAYHNVTYTTGAGGSLSVTVNVLTATDGPLVVTFDTLVLDTATIGATLTREFFVMASSSYVTELPYVQNVTDSDSVDFTMDSPTVSVPVVVSSSISETDTTKLAVGETVVIDNVFTLPEGSVYNAVLTAASLNKGGLTLLSAEIYDHAADISGVPVGTPLTLSDTNSDSLDDTATLNVGVLRNAGNNAGSDTVTVRVVAVVEDEIALVDGDLLGEQFTLDWVVASSTKSVSVSVDEPVYEMSLVATPSGHRFEAGETVTYTATVDAATSTTAGAFNVTVNITLPAGSVDLDVGSVSTSAGSVVASGNDAGNTYVTVEVGALPSTGDLTIVFTGTVVNSTEWGSQPVAVATLDYDSSPFDVGGRTGRVATQVVAEEAIRIDEPMVMILVLESTSLPGTSGHDVSIGELVTYEVSVKLPHGHADSANLTIVLPHGVPAGYLSAVSSVITAMSESMSSSTGLVETSSVSSASDVRDGGADGLVDELVFNFGEMSNLAGGDSDWLNFTFTSYVADVAGNVDGTVVSGGAAVFSYGGKASAQASVPVLNVVEPALNLTKIASPTVGDAGDLISYTILLSHLGSSTADAYNVTVIDPLYGVYFDLDIASVTASAGVVVTASSLGGIEVFVPEFALGDPEIWVTFEGHLSDFVQPGPLSNVVNATYLSSPNLLPANILGADDETVRMYTVLDTNTVDIYVPFPEIATVVESTSVLSTIDRNVTIGEEVTMQFTVSLGEGTGSQNTMVFSIPPVQAIVNVTSSSVVSIGSHLTGANTLTEGTLVDTDGDGYYDQVEFAFGPTTNAADNIRTEDDEITVEMTFVVANELPLNVDGGSFTVSAAHKFHNNVNTNSIPFEIVEPRLQATKTVTPSSADAGDLVQYTIAISHVDGTSQSSAYDVVVGDLLPADIELVDGSVSVSGGVVSSVATGNGGGDTSVSVEVYEIAVGETVYVNFTGRVKNTAEFSSTISSTATIDYFSAPYVNATERRGYTTDATDAGVTIASPTITSSFSTGLTSTTGTELAIGEVVTTTVSATLAEGTSPGDLTVTVAVPTGLVGKLELLSANVSGVGGSLTLPSLGVGSVGTPVDTDGDGLADSVTFNFGAVSNAYDNNALNGGDEIELSVLMIAADVAGNVDGVNVGGTTATIDWVSGSSSDVGSTFSVVEPALSVLKTSGPASADAGDVITYNVTVTHTGASTSSAYAVTVQDLLDAGITLIEGSVTSSQGVVTSGNGGGDTAVIVDVGEMSGPGTFVVQYQGRVENSAEFSSTISTDALLTYGSGSNGTAGVEDERVYSASSSDAGVTIASPTITSSFSTGLTSTTGTELAIGEVVTTTVSATLAEGTSPGDLTVTVAVPTGLVGKLELLSANVSGVGGSLTLPSLGVGSVGTPVDTDGDGLADSVTFNFGAVSNAYDNNALNGGDEIELSVLMIAADVAGNVDGVNVGGTTATIDWVSGSSSDVGSTFSVVEPALTVETAILDESPEGGDTVPLSTTLTSTGACTSNAYNMNVTVLLDSAFTFVPSSVQINGSSVTPMDVTATSFVVSLDELACPGAASVITYDAVLSDTVEPGQGLSQSAVVEYSSAPAGSAGARVYTVSGVGSSSASVEAPSILVQLEESSMGSTLGDDLAIGEIVVFNVSVPMPHSESETVVVSVSVSDGTLGSGLLSLTNATVSFIGAQLSSLGLTLGSPATLVDTNADTFFDTAVFNFSTVGNVPDGLRNADDELHMRLEGVVVNEAANVQGAVINVNASVTTTLIQSGVSSDVDLAVVEPLLDFVLSANATIGVVGDVVEYTMTLTPAAGRVASSYAVDATAQIPDYLDLHVGSVTVVSGSGAVVTHGNTGGDTDVRVTAEQVAAGDGPVTVTFLATVSTSLPEHASLNVTALLAYESVSASDDIMSQGRGYKAEDLAVWSRAHPGIIGVEAVSSDVTETPLSEAVVGEVVNFEVEVIFPPGQTNNSVVTIRGLPFGAVTGDTPRFELLSATLGSVGSALASSALSVGAVAVPVDTNGDGLADAVEFDLGTVSNAQDFNFVNDLMIFNVSVRLPKDASNANGDTVTLAVSLNYTDGYNEGSTSLTIVEPVLGVSRSVTTGPGGAVLDAGDSMDVNITIFVASGSTAPAAYNVTLTDTIEGYLVVDAGSLTSSVGTVSVDALGNIVLNIEAMDLTGDVPVTVTYSGVVRNDTRLNATYTSATEVVYQTSPEQSVSRVDRIEPSAFSFDVPAPVLTTDTPVKSDTTTAPSVVQVGEVIRVNATIRLGEGETLLSMVARTATSGARLGVLSATVVSVGGHIVNVNGIVAGSSSSGVDTNGDTVFDEATVDFGLTSNLPDNVVIGAGDDIVVEFEMYVPDVVENTDGATVSVDMSAVLDNGNVLESSSPGISFTVREPALAMTMTPALVSDVDGYSLVNVTVRVPPPTAGTTAYNVTVNDLAAVLSEAGNALELVEGSVTTTLGSVVSGNGGGDTAVAVSVPVYESGSTTDLVVTYQVRVPTVDFTRVGTEATVDWVSAATDAAATPESAHARAGVQLSDAVDVTIVAPSSLTAEFVGTSLGTSTARNVTVGETATWRATFGVPEAQLNNVVLRVNASGQALDLDGIVSATLAAGVTSSNYDGVSLAAFVAAHATLEGTGDDNSGGVWSLDFGTVTNANGDDLTADDIVVDFAMAVTDTHGVVAGDELAPEVAFSWTRDDTLGGNEAGTLTATAPAVTLAEPVVSSELAWSLPTLRVNPGEEFNMTVTALNADVGSATAATAYTLSTVVLLPPDLELTGTDYSSGAGGAVTVVETAHATLSGWRNVEITWTSAVDVGEAGIANVGVRVASGASVGTNMTVNGTSTWHSSPPGSPAVRVYTGNVEPAPLQVLSLIVNAPPVAVDDYVTVLEDTDIQFYPAANDIDPEEGVGNLDLTSCTILIAPTIGNATVNATNCEFTYRSLLHRNGADSLVYQVCDIDRACVNATVYFNVTQVLDAPDSPLPEVFVLPGNTNQTLDPLAQVVLIDEPIASVTVISLPAAGDVILTGGDVLLANTTIVVSGGQLVDGLGNPISLTYVPPAYWYGNVSLVLQACDTANLCTNVTIEASVFPPPPSIAQDDVIWVNGNATENNLFAPLLLNITSNDALNDVGSTSDIVFSVAPVYGTVEVVELSENSFSVLYTPAGGSLRNDSFTYVIYDRWGFNTSATMTIYTDGVFVSTAESSELHARCFGGQILMGLAITVGFEAVSFGSASRVWSYTDYEQLLTATGQMNGNYPNYYVNFTACFSWFNLAETFPWRFNADKAKSQTLWQFEAFARRTGDRSLLSQPLYEESIDFGDDGYYNYFASVAFIYWIVVAFLTVILLIALAIYPCVKSHTAMKTSLLPYTRTAHFTFRDKVEVVGPRWIYRVIGMIYRWTMFSYLGLWIAGTYQLAMMSRDPRINMSDSGAQFRLFLTIFTLGWTLFVFGFYVYWMRRRGTLDSVAPDIIPEDPAMLQARTEKVRVELSRQRCIGMSYLMYTDEHRWFYIAVYVRKILVGCFVGAFALTFNVTAVTQFVCVVIVYIVYLALVLYYRPFVSLLFFITEIWVSLFSVIVMILLTCLFLNKYEVDMDARQHLTTSIIWVHWAVMVGWFLLQLPRFILICLKCCGLYHQGVLYEDRDDRRKKSLMGPATVTGSGLLSRYGRRKSSHGGSNPNFAQVPTIDMGEASLVTGDGTSRFVPDWQNRSEIVLLPNDTLSTGNEQGVPAHLTMRTKDKILRRDVRSPSIFGRLRASLTNSNRVSLVDSPPASPMTSPVAARLSRVREDGGSESSGAGARLSGRRGTSVTSMDVVRGLFTRKGSSKPAFGDEDSIPMRNMAMEALSELDDNLAHTDVSEDPAVARANAVWE